jgi:elongation factor 1-beta
MFNLFLLQSISFILNRYRPTQGDVVVFEAVKKAPPAELENAARWYKHIASFNNAEKQK